MKIIQIIKDKEKLLGLGDDGNTYVYSLIKCSYWSEKAGKEMLTSYWMWRKVTNKDYLSDEGIMFEGQDKINESIELEKILSNNLDYDLYV